MNNHNQKGTEKKDKILKKGNKKSYYNENNPTLEEVWKIVTRIRSFSLRKMRRKQENDKIYARGFDDCLDWFRTDLEKLERGVKS